MSLSEKINSAKNEIDSIRIEANKKAMAEEETKRMTEAEKRRKEEKEIEEQNLADKNWQDLKPLLMNSLQEINKSMFDGQAQIFGWKKIKTEKHGHEESYIFANEQESYTWWHSLEVEMVSIQIKDVGSVSLFKVFTDYKDKYSGYLGNTIEAKTTDYHAKDFYIGTSERFCYVGKKGELSRPTLIFEPSELKSNLNKAEDIILEKIVALNKKSLLNK